MNERKQFTIVNGSASTTMPIKFGIPQRSVLGPTLFVLFTNDLPSRISAATTYMYADDTTLFCIGGTVDEVIRSMNLALEELYNWCNANKLTPHPKKSEALIITRAPFVGPLHQVRLCKTSIRWVTETRLLSITVDNKLTWSAHMLKVRKSFIKKLNLLKRSRFLSADSLLTFYTKVILPSINYGLTVWGGCSCQDIFNSLERLHTRAARIIFNLPRDMPTHEVLARCKWTTLEHQYKLSVIKLMFKINHGLTPGCMSNIINKRNSRYALRGENILNVPRFNTRYMKQSIAYRGATIWNAIARKDPAITNVTEISVFVREALKSNTFHNFDFNTTLHTTNKKLNDFLYI